MTCFFCLLVTESFRDFCKKEILTGENLYDAGDVYGLQVWWIRNDYRNWM